MPDTDALRGHLLTKLGVGDRRLNQLISQKEGETLLPRRLAILALAAESGISIRRFASEDDLSQLRAVRSRPAVTAVPEQPRAPTSPTRATPTHRRTPAFNRNPSKTKAAKPKAARRARTVFVVHGRNEALRRAMFAFLRSLSLDPIEWTKAIASSEKGSPSISEIVDAALNQAVAIVVLLTADDQVILKKQHRKSTDPSYESRLVGQARPNVLFEAGMAFGRSPNATVLVQVGDVKPFSDIGGRHVTRLGNDPKSRSELVTKLRNAGCDVDSSGTDWYSEGDFEVSEEKVNAAK